MAQKGSGGYVLRGTDGSLYLIRDEILEACKMEGEDLEYAKSKMGDEASAKPFSEFARVDYKDSPRWKKDVQEDVAEPRKMAERTTMCGW